MFGRFKRKTIQPLTDDQVKAITKVLIIDDEEPVELRELLRKEGWKHYYLPDLDALANKKLEESQIVFIDIMGVGKKLQEQSGIGLVKHIKQRYPEKKIVLYSSVSDHDIFSDALDYVDKRIRKQSSLVPFLSAIDEMARSTLSWDETIKFAYRKIEGVLPATITFEQFKANAEKSIINNRFDADAFSRKTGMASDVASLVSSLVSLAVAA